MAELRNITRRNVQSDFNRVTPQAGFAFQALGQMAEEAYAYLEPKMIKEQQQKAAEAFREYARSQRDQRTRGGSPERPTQDGGLGRIGEAPAQGASTPQVTTSLIDGDQQAFVSTLMPAAQTASERTGVDPRIIVAQAALESGWGKSAPGNNLFGIKSHGQAGGQTLSTTEVIDGETVRIDDSFRTFASPEESVQGYADFLLNNPRYGEMMQAQGLEAQVAALGASGYATDPDYAQKVMSIAASLPQSTSTVSASEDGTLSGAGFDVVDVSSVIGGETEEMTLSTLSAPQQVLEDQPETTVRTAEGIIEPRLFSPMSGPILQAYNASAGVAYVSEVTVSSVADLMQLSADHTGNPEAYREASEDYVEELVSQAPQQFQEDLRSSLSTESQRRFLGMVDEHHRDTDRRANNSSKALMERYSSDYAEALASGRVEDAEVARQQLEGILYARESLPSIAWTREQSENLLLDAMDEAEQMRQSQALRMSDEWRDQFDTIIEAANDNRTSEFDALVNNQSATAAHPELAREAAAMMTVRDSMPQFMKSPPAIQDQIIARERARPIGAEWETDVLSAMETYRDISRKALENDPVQYGMDHIAGAPPPLDPELAVTDPKAFANTMRARSGFRNKMIGKGWVDYDAFLTNDEVATFSALLGKDSPIEVRAGLAATLVSGFGPDATTVFGELNADPVTMFGGQLMSAGGPGMQATFMQALQGQELLDANQVQLPTGSARIASFLPDAATAMQGLPNIGAAQDQVMKFAQALYASSAQGISPNGEDAKALMGEATQKALGQATLRNGTVTGGVQRVTGHPVLLPVTVSGASLENAIQQSFAVSSPESFGDYLSQGGPFQALPFVSDASGPLDPTIWQEASATGSVPMYGGEPMSQSIFNDDSVRFVAMGGNTYRMEVVSGRAVHDITTDNGMVFMFDISKLIGR